MNNYVPVYDRSLAASEQLIEIDLVKLTIGCRLRGEAARKVPQFKFKIKCIYVVVKTP